MPEKVHRQLAARARKLGLKGKRFNAYVFGTLNKLKKHGRSKR